MNNDGSTSTYKLKEARLYCVYSVEVKASWLNFKVRIAARIAGSGSLTWCWLSVNNKRSKSEAPNQNR